MSEQIQFFKASKTQIDETFGNLKQAELARKPQGFVDRHPSKCRNMPEIFQLHQTIKIYTQTLTHLDAHDVTHDIFDYSITIQAYSNTLHNILYVWLMEQILEFRL